MRYEYLKFYILNLQNIPNRERNFTSLTRSSFRPPGNNRHHAYSGVVFGGLWLACLPMDPKFAGSNPAGGDGLLRTIQIRSTPSFGGEVKPSGHVVRFYSMVKVT
jgi:hypothetical protein